MKEESKRGEGQTVISVSLPRELLQAIDDRAGSLGLARSLYLSLLAEKDLRQLGPLVIHGDQAQVAEQVELTPEAYSFLLSAIPEMADYERRLSGKALGDLPKPPKSVTKSKLWELFLDKRNEILKHKWIQSEKAGRDIGMEAAIREWLQAYHPAWAQAHKVDEA
jgi:hypothetical protein